MELVQAVDTAALTLMDVDSLDSPQADELATILEGLAGRLPGPGGDACGWCAWSIRSAQQESLSLREVVRRVSETLSALQTILCDDADPASVVFPNAVTCGTEAGNAELPPELQESQAHLDGDIPQCDDVALGGADGEAIVEETPLEETAGKSEPFDTAPVERDPELMEMFVAEAGEHLDAAEPNLIALEQDPSDKEALDAVFRSFHTVKGSAGFAQLQPIEHLAHALEELLDLAREGKLLLTGDVMDLVLAGLDSLRRSTYATAAALDTKGEPAWDAHGHDLAAAIRARFSGDANAAEMLVPERPATLPLPTSDTKPAERSVRNAAEAIRVDRQRLDQLIDVIGELVIAESMVSAELGAQGSFRAETLPQLRKITRELQELSLSLRMMPIAGQFQKMNRVVRDLSRKLGKAVDLVVEGGETELDKSVIDEIGDPLMHLVRNSLDHGIERSSADRVAAGKPETATITLRAYHKGGNIYVEIEDDGAGINRERVLARAVERGIVSPDVELDDEDIDQLLFEPGFSTAAQVTEVSGRGVGMDVVRRNIESLRGSVGIRSERGVGTTVTLRLPLTLAIIDGMIVRVGERRFIIPTLSIVEQLRPESGMLARVKGTGEIVAVRGRNVPFHRLAEVFDLKVDRTPATDGIIVLVEEKDRLSGLFVDDVLGQQQVVIKSLGTAMAKDTPGVAGAAVMPDGDVGLILDVHGVLALARGERALHSKGA